ncbi:MAG: glycosyltransferase family 2 protein, partial [Thermoanaerobaculia bacterium]
MDILTTGCGLLAAWAVGPACDAVLRWRRLAAFSERSVPCHPPKRLLVLVPSRGEGARVGDLASDVRREAETAAASTTVDLRVLLDGPDPDASARLDREGVSYLSKSPPGPAKGNALAFLAEHLGDGIDASDYVLVFDADMRLPERFFRDLNVPDGAEVFQLPVRPAGVPGPGAPRVEALSLAETRLDDLARDAEGLPVRLRGKAMGFTPKAFRLGPAAATRTTAEDSEATLRLLTAGIRLRALGSPVAFDEPAPASAAMARSRARWLGGHLKLLFTGFGDLLRLAGKSPKEAFVLACDLWLRPRLFVLLALAFLAIGSDVAMVVFSSGATAAGAGAAARPVALLLFLLLLSLEAKTTLVVEWLSIAALRRHIGYPPEIPAVTLADLLSSLSMWARAAGRALLAPSR